MLHADAYFFVVIVRSWSLLLV